MPLCKWHRGKDGDKRKMGMEANIRQRKDGSFEARYKIGRNEKGRTTYASCYGKTYEEAVEKREKALENQLIKDNPPIGMNLLILGAGSHGQEVREIAESLHLFQKIDFLDDDTNKLEAIGAWGDFEELKNSYNMAIVAVGNEQTRKLWFAKLANANYIIPTLVHPSAIVSQNATLGAGTVICARATISSGAKIGAGCIISAGVTIGRDTEIDDWTHMEVSGVVRWK